jgi:hypothetical protein
MTAPSEIGDWSRCRLWPDCSHSCRRWPSVWIIRYNINAGLRSLQFRNLSAFWSSILSLYRRHSDFAIFEALTVLIIVIYFVSSAMD